MRTDTRRAEARRRAWGRGPMILRFEPLEGRELLTAAATAVAAALPDLVGSSFATAGTLEWGDAFQAKGAVLNQGTAATTGPFHVDIYASPTSDIGAASVLLGEVTVPGTLAPGQSATFDQELSLPSTPISGVDSAGTVYVGLVVNPDGLVKESSTANNYGRGQGLDTSVLTATTHMPAVLLGAALGVTPDRTAWGQTVRVTQQINNTGTGDAPATRARVVLTPAGSTPGGPADVTVGSLAIPAIPAGRAINVAGNVALPAVPPAALAGRTGFTLSVVQDVDFQTDRLSPHAATQGIGADQTPLVIALPAGSAQLTGPKPDLAPTSVVAPTLPIQWGQNFQVTAAVQNQGNLDSGPFKVRFLLVGQDGSLNATLFLADATLPGLKAGYSQNVVQTLSLPARLPDGEALNAGAVAKVAVVVDPENTLNESNRANNSAVSNAVTLVLPATTAATTAAIASAKTTAAATAKAAAREARVAALVARQEAVVGAAAHGSAAARRRLIVHPAHHSLEHNFKVFPSKVTHYFRNVFKTH